jgi:probable F420-dependent oxidoreductase
MRFGLGQFTLQLPPWDKRDHAQLYADTLELAELADEGGFNSLWLAEHHGAEDGYVPATLAFLSAVAARTSRLEIGTAVLLAPLHNPLRVAEDAAVVDNISGGRLSLGLGLGWVAEEYRMFGIDLRTRGRRLEEFVEVLRRAWTGERFTFEGRYYPQSEVLVRPRPAHPVTIFLGGGVDKAIERAALLGDGHYPASTTAGSEIAVRAQKIAEIRKAKGLDLKGYRFGFFVSVGIGTDPEDGWAKIRDGRLHVAGSYGIWAQGGTDVSKAREVAAGFEDQMRASAVVGTPQQIADQLRPILDGIRDAGFEDVFVSAILAPPGTPPDLAREQVETYASKVIPLLRD